MLRRQIAAVVLILVFAAIPVSAGSSSAKTLKALIVDGQNNHNWQETTPVLKKLLEQTGLYKVDVATSPAKKEPMEDFKPAFARYDVVICNYTGDEWPAKTRKAFERYMKNGGGLVVFHAADNAFPQWQAYNEMIAIGGWGGRNEKSGPMVRWRDGKVVYDTSDGKGGQHPPQHEFQVITRDKQHPITAGLPEKWMHASDELYSALRGPAKNMTVLATAYCDPDQKNGSGEHEPTLELFELYEKIKSDSQKIELQVQTFYRKSNMPVFTCQVNQTLKGSEIEIKPKNIKLYLFFIVVIWCLFLADSIFRVQYHTTLDVIGTVTLAIIAPLFGAGLVFFIHYWYIDTVVANLKKILKE